MEPVDHLHLPILQFIRDDKETVAIMKEALRIVPKVCDILDEEEIEAQAAANTAQRNQRLGSANRTTIPRNSNPPISIPSTSSTAAASGHSNGQSPSTRNGPVKRSYPGSGSPPPLPPKKRLLANLRPENQNLQSQPQQVRVESEPPSQSRANANTIPNRANANGNMSITGAIPARRAEIKRQLQEDYDKFVSQIGFLASLERRKNDLLERFLRVSAQASAARRNAQSQPSAGTNDDSNNINQNGTINDPPPPEEGN